MINCNPIKTPFSALNSNEFYDAACKNLLVNLM